MNTTHMYTLFFDIAHQSGINAKKTMLLNDEDLKKVLRYCYDPFKRFYITPNQCITRRFGSEDFSDVTWMLFDHLADRTYTGQAAQHMVRAHKETLNRQSCFIFNRILMKDMRIGLGTKTINSRFPGLIPEHKIMRAKLLDESKVRYPCWSSGKIDGLRAIYRDRTFYMRGGKPFYGMEHLVDELATDDIPMDGELHIPGWEFNDMSGQLRSDDQSPIAVYRPWDLPEAAMSFENRYRYLLEICRRKSDMIKPVMHHKVCDSNELWAMYHNHRDLGLEGSVIKSWDYKYKDNRSYDWMKIKDFIDEDLPICGIYEGKGKYRGMMGGVYVNRNGKACKVGGGWSDIERQMFWETPGSIDGNIIEVRFQEETKTGNMRHARKLRFRDDKE